MSAMLLPSFCSGMTFYTSLWSSWVICGGGVNVGDHEMSLCDPEDHFSVSEINNHEVLMAPAQLQKMVCSMDVQWAFQGSGSLDPHSWLLLQRNDGNGSESCRIVLFSIQSREHKVEACMQLGRRQKDLAHVRC